MYLSVADGIKIFYIDAGKRDGTPMVFVHGWTANLYRWAYQFMEFGKEYRIIAFDLRGHGRSTKTLRGLDIKTAAEDLKKLVDHLKLDKFILFGHSMGGMIALFFAIRYPDMVQKLIICSSAARPTLMKGMSILQDLFQFFTLALIHLLIGYPFRVWLSVRSFNDSPETTPEAHFHDWRPPNLVAVKYLINVTRVNLIPYLYRITAPTLFIFGKRDTTIRPRLRATVGGVPNHKIVFIDAKHDVMIEAREEFNKVVREFIEKT